MAFYWIFTLLIAQIGNHPKEFTKTVKTKECPSCAMEVDDKAKVCPICQFEFPNRSPWITWMAIFLVIIWLLSYIL
jgi:RNA polymerase subunit RPABC4/transcription elongation factor Spt4